MPEDPSLDPWLARNLACPKDLEPLSLEHGCLICPSGHSYPVVEGIPVLLLDEAVPTQEQHWKNPGVQAESAGLPPPSQEVDPFVQRVIAATSGDLYRSLAGKLSRYPIPDCPLPYGQGRYVLDLGCNWGRWCISAARKGYVPVGIDPNLEAVLAARRVARQLEVPALFAAADARHLPFPSESLDAVFSYSVLQHFDKEDALQAIGECGRVLRRSGFCVIQMPNAWGLHNLLHQLKRGFRRPHGFEVRYWTPGELKALFRQRVGPTSLSVDGFFSLNPRPAGLEMLSPINRLVVSLSEALRSLSEKWPWLVPLADSLFVHSSASPARHERILEKR